MFDKTRIKGYVSYLLIALLFILAFFIIKPILSSIIYGALLAYIFYPIFRWVNKGLKSKTLSAWTVCVSFFVILAIILAIIFTALFKQAVNFYLFFREVNIGNLITSMLPEFMRSSNFPVDLSGTVNSFLSNLLVGAFSQISNFIAELPIIALNFFIVIIVFYYGLKHGEEIVEYIKSLSPMNKDTEDKFFKQLKDITNSVLVGHILVGLIQGIFAGIGYFIFGVPNALLLTILTSIVAVIPVVGAWLGWLPVDIYLFATGHTTAGIGLLIYGLFFVSTIDNILRMIIVSRKTEVNAGIIMIGMIGGGFLFGFLGLIIGPLVLAYVLLILDLYRKHTLGEEPIFKKAS